MLQRKAIALSLIWIIIAVYEMIILQKLLLEHHLFGMIQDPGLMMISEHSESLKIL